MASILFTSFRNWCSCTQFVNFSAGRVPLTKFAVLLYRSKVRGFGCLSVSKRIQATGAHRNCIGALQRWQKHVNTDLTFGCIRKISASNIMYTVDEHDKGDAKNVRSTNSDSSTLDDDYNRESGEKSVKFSHFEAGSARKDQPLSDAEVDKELLRYDYEEFELLPDEEVGSVQPVEDSIPVELTSKFLV